MVQLLFPNTCSPTHLSYISLARIVRTHTPKLVIGQSDKITTIVLKQPHSPPWSWEAHEYLIPNPNRGSVSKKEGGSVC